MEVDLQKTLMVAFRHFHGKHFEHADHGAMYSQIFTDNIIIYRKNIYQVLKYVGVVSQ